MHEAVCGGWAVGAERIARLGKCVWAAALTDRTGRRTSIGWPSSRRVRVAAGAVGRSGAAGAYYAAGGGLRGE